MMTLLTLLLALWLLIISFLYGRATQRLNVLRRDVEGLSHFIKAQQVSRGSHGRT